MILWDFSPQEQEFDIFSIKYARIKFNIVKKKKNMYLTFVKLFFRIFFNNRLSNLIMSALIKFSLDFTNLHPLVQ